MAAANPVITRDEFDRMGKRLTALEASRSTAHADTQAPNDEVARFDPADFVRQGEFRLFKWLGTFAFATVLGGFGLLYEQTSDLRVAMERLNVDLLREMHAEHTASRDEMHAQFTRIRDDMHAQFTRIRDDMHAQFTSLREDMYALHNSTREDMHAQHAATRSEIASVRERVVRLETLGVETD